MNEVIGGSATSLLLVALLWLPFLIQRNCRSGKQQAVIELLLKPASSTSSLTLRSYVCDGISTKIALLFRAMHKRNRDQRWVLWLPDIMRFSFWFAAQSREDVKLTTWVVSIASNWVSHRLNWVNDLLSHGNSKSVNWRNRPPAPQRR